MDSLFELLSIHQSRFKILPVTRMFFASDYDSGYGGLHWPWEISKDMLHTKATRHLSFGSKLQTRYQW